MTDDAIKHNITKVNERIRIAAQKSQRDPESITLLAVSKTRSAHAVQTAHASGVTDIGENYLQEALEKQEALSALALCWHFIGPVQSNKTGAIARHFDWVHSVDRLKIAKRLSAARAGSKTPLQVFLQVNISDEDSKAGVSLAELPALAATVCELPQLQLRGLMAIPRPEVEFQQQRTSFARLRQQLESLQTVLPQHSANQFNCLSMGMSADLEAAIAEGATHLRIGTDIFGPRNG